MLAKLLLVFLGSLAIVSNTEAAFGTTRSAPPAIKVLLVHDKMGVVLEVKGKYSLYDPRTYSHISTRFIGKRKFMQALKDGLKWGEEFPGLHQILIVPERPETTTLVDGVEYKGAIYVYDVEGKVSVVNAVDIEDYLQSILSDQNKKDLPQEALNALIIAARTTAYYQASHPKSVYWAIDAKQIGYKGDAVINPNEALQKAINETRYMVMSRFKTDQQALPFPAQWGVGDKTLNSPDVVTAKITLEEAAELATKGDNAAKILEIAFPGSPIVLMYYQSKK